MNVPVPFRARGASHRKMRALQSILPLLPFDSTIFFPIIAVECPGGKMNPIQTGRIFVFLRV